jgi:hypothetical protein
VQFRSKTPYPPTDFYPLVDIQGRCWCRVFGAMLYLVVCDTSSTKRLGVMPLGASNLSGSHPHRRPGAIYPVP